MEKTKQNKMNATRPAADISWTGLSLVRNTRATAPPAKIRRYKGLRIDNKDKHKLLEEHNINRAESI